MTGPLTISDTTLLVKEYAREVGFDLVRITSAEEFAQDRARALERIRDGLMDGLPWYSPARVSRGSRPGELLPGARSIICLGLNYYPDYPDEPQESDGPDTAPAVTVAEPALTGRIARYARGRDYHKVIKQRMRAYVADYPAGWVRR